MGHSYMQCKLLYCCPHEGNKELTKCYATCKLINSSLGHAIGQHTRELQREKLHFFEDAL